MPIFQNSATFNPDDPAFQPVQLVEVELSAPLPGISPVNNGRHYKQARVLVRAYTYPIGHLNVQLRQDGLDAASLAAQIWQTLHQALNDFLTQNGLPAIKHLDASGLPPVAATPLFKQERTQIMKDAPFVSVVVCTRDRTEQLRIALDSLLELEYPNYEIIVVDNAPKTQATAELVNHYANHSEKIHYTLEHRPGLSFARNCGLNCARGEVIAYTDDDIIADPHWLTEVVRGFKAGEKVGCVTGPLPPTELDSPVQLLNEQFRGRSMEFSRRIFDMGAHKPADALYPWAAGIFGGGGANMSFRTDLLRKIGGFDPALGTGTPTHGGEDLAVFVDLVKRGYQIVYEPSAIIYHASRTHYDALRRQLYGYGVGLTAYLTRFILAWPTHFFDIAPKAGRGLYYLLSSKSIKNHKRNLSYPGELSRAELRGMLYGPIAYVRSRRLVAEKRS